MHAPHALVVQQLSASATSAVAMPRRRYEGCDREAIQRAAPAVPSGDDRPDDRVAVEREHSAPGERSSSPFETVGIVGGRRLRGRVEPEREDRVDVGARCRAGA